MSLSWNDIDWKSVLNALGVHSFKKGKGKRKEIVFQNKGIGGYQMYTISDNGGEVNISIRVSFPNSISYDFNTTEDECYKRFIDGLGQVFKSF